MKILILTYGSRGDVQPFVALGKGLKESGHDVTLATSVRFQSFVEDNNLRYGFMNDDMLSILDTDQGKSILENTSNIFQTVRQTFKMMGQVGPMQRSLLSESWTVAQNTDPDLIIFHPKAYAAPHIGEKLDVPVIMATPIPVFVPTAERPNIGFPDLKIGGWYNRQTYHMVNGLMGLSAKKHIKAFREACDLPKQSKFDLLHTPEGKDIPVLHAYSEKVIPEPADWPDSAKTTGYWFLDEGEDWQPPAELVTFLQNGPPPVYIGFGSMAGRDPERLARVVVNALEKANLRGIIATGWGGLKPEELPETILQIDHAPHSWLFPRMQAIVHHGGAGTTAAALRAGKPSVVVPFFGDQPFWGKRVHDLGVGSAPIPQKRLEVDELVSALLKVTSDEDIIEAARIVGERIREEDGVKQAIAIINSPEIISPT